MTSSSLQVIYLLRHTQTVWNANSRYQGRIDTELSETGIADANRITQAAQPGDFSAVFSSPLRRALSLASSISDRVACELHIDDRLTEIAMGPWEGLTREEIEQRFPDLFRTWQSDSDEVLFPGGESLIDVADRVQSFMDDRFAADSPRVILVVSHDAVIKVALMLALGLELKHLHRFRMRNGSVSILRGRQFAGSVETVDSLTHLSGSPFRIPPLR